MEKIDRDLLKAVADLHDVPAGAYNIRKNSGSAGRKSTENIQKSLKRTSRVLISVSLPERKTNRYTFPLLLPRPV